MTQLKNILIGAGSISLAPAPDFHAASRQLLRAADARAASDGITVDAAIELVAKERSRGQFGMFSLSMAAPVAIAAIAMHDHDAWAMTLALWLGLLQVGAILWAKKLEQES